jgi:hypothetical protein
MNRLDQVSCLRPLHNKSPEAAPAITKSKTVSQTTAP